MSTEISRLRLQRSTGSMSLNATISIAVVLTGFAILHVIGAAMLQPAWAKSPTADARPIFDGD
jgi:hypothetical protein